MDEQLSNRVRAAAAAGWSTVILFAVLLTASWLIVLTMMHTRPAWVLALCGGGAFTWDDLQKMYLWFFGVLKMLLLAGAMISAWLTLWSRRLRRQG